MGISIGVWAASAALAAFAQAAPAGSAPEPAPEQTARMAEAERVATELDWEKLVTEEAYAEQVVPHMALIEQTSRIAGQVEFARHVSMFALLRLGRFADAAAVSEKLVAAKPEEAGYYRGIFLGYLLLDQDEKAVGAIERAVASVSDPQGIADLNEMFSEDAINHLFQRLYQTRDEARRMRAGEALARIGWPGAGRPVERDRMRALAVRARLMRGDRAGAAAMARELTDVDALLELLVQRKFDPLFGSDADRVARLRAAIEATDAATAEALAAEAGDVRRLLTRMQFLRSVGRDEEALKLVEPTLADIEAVERTGDQAFWIVNDAAYALVQAGRAAEAVALMDRLLALDADKHPMLVSMSINFVEILSGAGLHQRALDHALRISETQSKHASDYGRMWMEEGVVCSLAALGRAAEAAPRLERLRASGDTNPSARTRAMLCVGDLDGAERLLIERLQSKDPEQALVAVQRYRMAGRRSAVAELTQDRWAEVIARPAVQQAIARVGRVLELPLVDAYWGSF